MDAEVVAGIAADEPAVTGFWLRFEPKLERGFRAAHMIRSLGQMRFTLLVAAIFYGLFAPLDVLVAPDAVFHLWLIRFGVFVPAAMIAFLLTWRPWFPRYAQAIMIAITLLGGAGIIAMLPIIPPAAAHVYYAGLMLVFILGYTWARILFPWATAVGWLLVLLYEVVAIGVVDTPGWVIISNSVFFISGNILAMLACRALESFAREEYVVTRRLRKEEERSGRAIEELGRLTEMDGLTGLDNRRVFDETLEHEWRRARRTHDPLSLIIGDVDRFKQYNDALGHLAGDDCLRLVASALQMQIRRPTDRLARYGGEEFAVILPNTDVDGAEIVAESLLAAVRDLATAHPGQEDGRPVSMSFGVASLVPTLEQGAHHLEGLADAALFAAKRAGRDRVVAHKAVD